MSSIQDALYPHCLDQVMNHQNNTYYVRYMDNILIATKTRWQNRRTIKLLNQAFNELKIKQLADKTFIGKIER